MDSKEFDLWADGYDKAVEIHLFVPKTQRIAFVRSKKARTTCLFGRKMQANVENMFEI